MRKIPSIFVRDWSNNPSLITSEINPECQWVFDGEGAPTRKWDGTACMVRNGDLYKRYDAKINRKTGEWKPKPKGFEQCQEPDKITGHQPGWIPVDFSLKENKWYKMAWDLIDKSWYYYYLNNKYFHNIYSNPKEIDGTYELCGITINNNPEKFNGLYFVKHKQHNLYFEDLYSRTKYLEIITFAGLIEYFKCHYIEGIVWHHLEDDRMAKIKRIDFGLEWKGSKNR